MHVHRRYVIYLYLVHYSLLSTLYSRLEFSFNFVQMRNVWPICNIACFETNSIAIIRNKHITNCINI